MSFSMKIFFAIKDYGFPLLLLGDTEKHVFIQISRLHINYDINTISFNEPC